VWHTLEIEAQATKFSFKLNGQQLLPVLDNPNFRRGKIGYWTKSDSISHFVDTRITYQPTVIQAQRLVNSALERFDRLEALRVLLPDEQAGSTKIVAGTDPAEIGQPGIAEERLVIDTGEFMYLVGDGEVTVTLPLKDRNGEIIAALRVTMKRFRGQTQKNAIIRTQPVVAHFQNNLFDRDDLFE
jgi:hypothetical protein